MTASVFVYTFDFPMDVIEIWKSQNKKITNIDNPKRMKKRRQ